MSVNQIRIVAVRDYLEISQGTLVDNVFTEIFKWKTLIVSGEYNHPWQDFLVISTNKGYYKNLTIRMIECRNFSYSIEAKNTELIDFMTEEDIEITGYLSPCTVKAKNITINCAYIAGLNVEGHYECNTFRFNMTSYKLCLRTTIHCKQMFIDVRCCDILADQIANITLNCETFEIKADITNKLTVNLSKYITPNMVKRTNEFGNVFYDRVIELINISGSFNIVSTIKDKSSCTIFKGITADKGIRIDFYRFIYLEGDYKASKGNVTFRSTGLKLDKVGNIFVGRNCEFKSGEPIHFGKPVEYTESVTGIVPEEKRTYLFWHIYSNGATANMKKYSISPSSLVVMRNLKVESLWFHIHGEVAVFGNANLHCINVALETGKLTVRGNLNSKAIIELVRKKTDYRIECIHGNWCTDASLLRVTGNCTANSITNQASTVFVGGKYTGSDINSVNLTQYITNTNYSIFLPAVTTLCECETNGDLVLEGITQGRELVSKFTTMRVGSLANYRRPPVPKFEQFMSFLSQKMHLSSLFNDINNSVYMRTPSFPIKLNIPLDPAVVVTPTGFRLIQDNEKFQLHYLEEIDQLTNVFVKQLQRACLNWENTDNTKTYIQGRKNAYDLFISQNSIGTMDTNISFMVLYSSNNDILTPISWVRDNTMRFDGLYFEQIQLEGKRLHNIACIEGTNSAVVEVDDTQNERASYNYTVYQTNHYCRKGGFMRGNKRWSETVAINCREAQENTGIIRSNNLLLKGNVTNTNGGELQAGTLELDLDNIKCYPTITTTISTSEESYKKFYALEHHARHSIHPCKITARTIRGRLGTSTFNSTNMISQGDISILSKYMKFGAPIYSNVSGTPITRHITQLALPSCIVSINGNIDINGLIEGTGVLKGNKVNLEEVKLESVLLKNVTKTTLENKQAFSTTTRTEYTESPVSVYSAIEADSLSFDKAVLNGVYVKAKRIEGNTLKQGYVKNGYSYRVEVNSSQPLCEVNSGVEGYNEIVLDTILDCLDIQIKTITRETCVPISWSREWCHKSQVVPDKVIAVACIALTIFLPCASILQAILNAAAIVGTGTLLRTGDLQATAKSLISDNSLKSYLTAAIVGGVSSYKTLVAETLNVVVHKKKIGHAFRDLLITEIAASAANMIGVKVSNNYIAHKLCHGILGGVIAAAKKECVFSGITAGMLSEVLVNYMPVNQARFASVVLITAMGGQPYTVDLVANNALANNFSFTEALDLVMEDWRLYGTEFVVDYFSWVPLLSIPINAAKEGVKLYYGQTTVNGIVEDFVIACVAGKTIKLIGAGAKKLITKFKNRGKIPLVEDLTKPVWSINEFNRSNATILELEDKSFQNVLKIPQRNGAPHIVTSHGTERFMFQITDAQTTYVGKTKLARILRNDQSYKKGTDIALLSCDTGKGSRSLAQGIADEMRVNVYAPTGFFKFDLRKKTAYVSSETGGHGVFKKFVPTPAPESNTPSLVTTFATFTGLQVKRISVGEELEIDNKIPEYNINSSKIINKIIARTQTKEHKDAMERIYKEIENRK